MNRIYYVSFPADIFIVIKTTEQKKKEQIEQKQEQK